MYGCEDTQQPVRHLTLKPNQIGKKPQNTLVFSICLIPPEPNGRRAKMVPIRRV